LLHWFAVLTKPRAEAEAVVCLGRQGFECLHARTRRTVRAAAGMIVRTEALFPRYVFIRSDPTLQSLAPVRSTRGCVGLVRFGGEPARVPEAVIDQIRARIDNEDGFVRLAPPPLVKGARVRINEGPFTGIDAIFEAEAGEDRVLLLLMLLGTERSVVVPRAALGARI
jgi:transcriptional antiterminator RfaH